MEALGALSAINYTVGTDTNGKSLIDRIKHFWWWIIGRYSCKIMFDNCTAVQRYKLILVLAEQAYMKKIKHLQSYTCENHTFYIPTKGFTMLTQHIFIYPLINTSDIVGYVFWSKTPWKFGLWSHIDQIFHSRSRNKIYPI